MKGSKIHYSEVELLWIYEHRTKMRKEAHAQFVEKFGRNDVSLNNFNALCKRKGWMTGRTGTFVLGQVPANKGRKMPYHPNSAATRFKKGQSPSNAKPLGHERVSKDGYIEISIDEVNPHTGFPRRFVHKHRYLWEQQHGTIPDGYFLKCLDGNKQNCDPSNWELLPRGTQPFLNGHRGHDYEAAPAEIKPTIIALAKLKHKKGQAMKAKKEKRK